MPIKTAYGYNLTQSEHNSLKNISNHGEYIERYYNIIRTHPNHILQRKVYEKERERQRKKQRERQRRAENKYYISNSDKIKARKLKIRLTRNVNGKRVKRTGESIRNNIKTAIKKEKAKKIPSLMKNIAKNLKIPLTKSVNGKREQLTKNELKHKIWVKTGLTSSLGN
tara:strand:+ start:12 stop:515 length:504 start_codon:yes stop_codon:yes gene_type:complete